MTFFRRNIYVAVVSWWNNIDSKNSVWNSNNYAGWKKIRCMQTYRLNWCAQLTVYNKWSEKKLGADTHTHAHQKKDRKQERDSMNIIHQVLAILLSNQHRSGMRDFAVRTTKSTVNQNALSLLKISIAIQMESISFLQGNGRIGLVHDFSIIIHWVETFITKYETSFLVAKPQSKFKWWILNP